MGSDGRGGTVSETRAKLAKLPREGQAENQAEGSVEKMALGRRETSKNLDANTLQQLDVGRSLKGVVCDRNRPSSPKSRTSGLQKKGGVFRK